MGVGATDALLDDLRARVKGGEITGPDALVDALKADLVAMLSAADASLAVPGQAAVAGGQGPDVPADTAQTGGTDTPTEAERSDDAESKESSPVDVWLFVGVNGVGKTTTVGKVANRLSAVGHQGPLGRR